MNLQHPDNFPVGYDRGHKSTCEWPDCPGGTDCEGLSLMTKKTTPAVGDTVHYTDHINHGGGYARCFDAEVTAVNPDGSIDIDELLPGAVTPAYSVIEQGKPGDLYTWHWPEPTEAERETNRLLHHITGGDFL